MGFSLGVQLISAYEVGPDTSETWVVKSTDPRFREAFESSDEISIGGLSFQVSYNDPAPEDWDTERVWLAVQHTILNEGDVPDGPVGQPARDIEMDFSMEPLRLADVDLIITWVCL